MTNVPKCVDNMGNMFNLGTMTLHCEIISK